jgi:hypothetical protein
MESNSLYVATVDGEIVGFQIGELLSSGILQIKSEWQRKGVGTALVNHMVRLNKRRNQWVLHIECNPETSKPFWESMGFKIALRDGRVYGHRILSSKLKLPAGRPVGVEVGFYPERAKREKGVQPFQTYTLQCIEVDGVVFLPQPVAGGDPPRGEFGDLVVKVAVEGRKPYLDKAKYPASKALGIRQCRNGWWLRTVRVE